MKRLLLAIFGLSCVVSSVAHADFTATAPGPLVTAGFAGDPGNGVFTAVYAGPTASWAQLNFTGNISPLVGGTWIDDARFIITGPNGATVTYRPSGVQTYPANTPVNASTNVFLPGLGAPGTYSFEAIDVFNDGPGPEAVWNSASFTFVDGTAAPISLGSFANNTPFTFDTNGSNYDTEIGLFNALGGLIANDDDNGDGLNSLITPGFLAPGDYTFVVGGFNSAFGNGFATAGAAGGSFLLNLNGANVGSGLGLANQFNFFTFNVSNTPAPAAAWLGIAGVGVLAGLRRRFVK